MSPTGTGNSASEHNSSLLVQDSHSQESPESTLTMPNVWSSGSTIRGHGNGSGHRLSRMDSSHTRSGVSSRRPLSPIGRPRPIAVERMRSNSAARDVRYSRNSSVGGYTSDESATTLQNDYHETRFGSTSFSRNRNQRQQPNANIAPSLPPLNIPPPPLPGIYAPRRNSQSSHQNSSVNSLYQSAQNGHLPNSSEDGFNRGFGVTSEYDQFHLRHGRHRVRDDGYETAFGDDHLNLHNVYPGRGESHRSRRRDNRRHSSHHVVLNGSSNEQASLGIQGIYAPSSNSNPTEVTVPSVGGVVDTNGNERAVVTIQDQSNVSSQNDNQRTPNAVEHSSNHTSTVPLGARENGARLPNGDGQDTFSHQRFDDQIEEEMARAQQMSIPVNFTRGDGRRRVNSSSLNPQAQGFTPTLRDARGNSFTVTVKHGMQYFHPNGSTPESNPEYIIPTEAGRGYQDASTRNNVQHNERDLTATQHHETNGQSHDIVAQNFTDQNGYPYAVSAPPVAAPYDHIYSLPQSQEQSNQYVNDHSAFQNVGEGVYFESPTIVQNGMANSDIPGAYPTNQQYVYPQPQQNYFQYPVVPTIVNGEQQNNGQQMGYTIPGQDMVQTPAQPVQFQHPPYVGQLMVTMPNQPQSPLVGYHQSLTSVILAPQPAPPLTPVTPGNQTSVHIQHPLSGTFVIGQMETTHNPQGQPQPPVMNIYHTYSAMVDDTPSDLVIPTDSDLPPFSLNCVHDNSSDIYNNNDKIESIRSRRLKRNAKDNSEFARKVISKFVGAVKRCERSSYSPLSDKELIDMLVNETTGDLFGVATPHTETESCQTANIVEIDLNDGESQPDEHNKNSGELSDGIEDISNESLICGEYVNDAQKPNS